MAHDLLIVGAGPVGLALALALRDSGLDIALADARERGAVRRDPRVLALAHGSRLTLERLGVWAGLPVTAIQRIHVSQQGGFGRTVIEAAEHGLPGLGYVVSAGALAAALDDAVSASGIPLIERARVAHVAANGDTATLTLDTAPPTAVSARLVACAEGGMSDDDPQVVHHDYHQHAIITLATPAGAHDATAYERFTAEGPLALLPCGERFAVVHTVSPTNADRLLALPEADYLGEVERGMGGRVRLTRCEERLRYPLQLRYRRQPVGERTLWLGNAAQTLHPVAGQGFNLALRDVWALARRLIDTPRGSDPGDAGLLAAYARDRHLDRRGTIVTTDGLVRLFSNDFTPLRQARGAALLALDALPPLRAILARRMMFGARAWP